MTSGFSTEAGPLDLEELRRLLTTRVFGTSDKLLYLPVVNSTNTFAMQLVHQRPEEGVVVLTDSQTAGKGRLGRHWVDVSGRNVLSSTLLRPRFPLHFLVMIASLAVVDALSDTCGVVASIKWPNDVLVEDRKIAGILVETCHHASGQLIAVLGIGVNVNGRSQDLAEKSDGETPLARTAITLEDICGYPVSRETLIAHLLQHIETLYLALQQEAIGASPGLVSRSLYDRWRGRLSTLGRTIDVRQNHTLISGTAEDVDESGALLLRLHSGELVNITWGDVGYPTR